MHNRLKDFRIKQEKSGEEIANMLNLSEDEYLDKERGKVSLTNYEMKLLCQYYDIGESDLLSISDGGVVR